MARVSVTTEQISRDGLDPSAVAVAPTVDGDVIDTGAVFLYVENAGAAGHTVTVQSPVTVDGLDVAELAVLVPAGGVRMIGPFPKRTFGRPVGDVDAGRAYVDYTAGADVDLVRAVVSL